jgi:1-deoxy-D-xylulose-5-phosphate reductoisomerase
LYLTASGGPFRGKTRKDLENVTPEQALAHPTWRMGGKITVDSATLMNKGLETIEAHWLFGVPTEDVHVVVHPQSIIHSMVKFKDGSVLAQLGWPDMRLPISYALLYPERVPNLLPPWNPMDSPSLTFEEVDHQTFPSIRLAQEAARIGGTMPCAMNAANEEAANAFLSGRIRFLQISEIVERAMEAHRPTTAVLETVLTTDDRTREFVRRVIVSL